MTLLAVPPEETRIVPIPETAAAVPPEEMLMVPPELTVVLLATPPEDMSILVPLSIIVLRATPPEEICIVSLPPTKSRALVISFSAAVTMELLYRNREADSMLITSKVRSPFF